VAITKITRLPDDVVSTAKVADDSILNVKVSPTAAIDQSKISSLSTSISNICSSVTSATADNVINNFNIGLLGFKMAVNESLTVFNLIDGVVDEFQDESGTDEAEGSNDLYNSTDDYYINSTSPDGTPPATATSATIVSETFSSIGTPTTSRIVVFEEDIDTPTLNTDIIASVSRDGTNFTTATLSDSGYVTGSSGQRILTGQADISGQPSGQSMRWKLQLANNQVKIHGVSLSWA
jgi:hypothetical protein